MNAVPPIRFVGFTDPWEQRKLGELLFFQNGFNGSRDAFGDGIPLISVMDILSDGFITHETVRGKARLNDEETKRFSVDYGDVLFQRSSENYEDAGTSNVYLDQLVSASFGGFVIRGKKVADYDPVFIKFHLNSKSVRSQITCRAQGAQHINVSQETLSDVYVRMPEMDEQKVVGSVLLRLDNLITLHQRKYDRLTVLKKALLEKMFPRDGASEPEIRFAGFTDPWEQRKLGELCEINSGRDYKHLDEGDVPVYGTGGYMLSVNEALSQDRDAVGIGRKGTIDKPYKLRAPFWTVDTLFYCIPADSIDLGFLEGLFLNVDWASKDESTGLPSLSKAIISDVDVLVPGQDEQKAISDIFASLDLLITLHQRKLEALRNLKSSLLAKMFV
ncbi:MAG: restriction endonuclease subunit S [Atopobiaceae bacterium]|nr:restriction endonuclease subunit S [Atopobiaceae bacterium]